MAERSEKENKGLLPSAALSSVLTAPTMMMDAADVFGAGAVDGGTLMLSPPPEEELRTTQASPAKRVTLEPLVLSSRSNQSTRDKESQQQQEQQQHQQQPYFASPLKAAAKRKRTITNNTSMNLGSPQRATTSSSAAAVVQTPNPRVRKQGRHAGATSPASSPRKGRANHPDPAPDLDALPQSPTRRSGTPSKPTSHTRARAALQSPHARNALADYIPPALLVASPRGAAVRRRSVTPIPIPPYEPPPERFTPPREIMGTPVGAETKKRQGKKKKKGAATKQQRVKQELPEIDLNAPLPPPSPGDDPILLVGPPTPELRLRRRSSGLSKEASLVDFEMELDLPENAPRNVSNDPADSGIAAPSPRRAVVPVFDFSGIGEDVSGGGDFGGDFGGGDDDDDAGDSGGEDLGTRVADLDVDGADSGWSDDDDMEGPSLGEGDFTGRFVEFHKRTKPGPPTERVDRPVSPHPKRLSLEGVLQPDDADETEASVSAAEESEKEEEKPDVKGDAMEEGTAAADSRDEGDAEANLSPGYEDRRGRRLTLSEVEAIKFGPREPSPVQGGEEIFESSYDASREEQSSREQESMEQHEEDERSAFLEQSVSLENQHEESMDMDTGSANILDDNILNKRPLGSERSQTSCISMTETAVDPQEQIMVDEAEGSDADDSSSSDDATSDASVVKIMSDNPMAAARAAAILKLYDYDMIAKKLKMKRRATSGGVSKRYSSPKVQQTWRRRTVAGLSAEENLLANVTLPELLEKAEHELLTSPARSRLNSVTLSEVGSPTKTYGNGSGLGFTYEHSDLPGPREWTKADWKLLDSCFTDERYDLAEEQGLEAGCLASADDVNLDSVVERFAEHMGGIEVVESHGPAWSSEKLLNRARALCKRQRAGNGAPPTPDVSSRFSTPSRFLSPTPSMIVPDFTPMGAGRILKAEPASPLSRKATLPPPATEPFFRSASVQPSLPAKQSRLRQDVTSAVLETPPRQSVSLFGFATPSRTQQGDDDDSDDESVALEVENMLTPNTAARFRSQAEPGSAVKRSLSYISTWLKPGMFDSKEERRRNGQQKPGLPVPPPDLLERPRGPVETPAPKPAEKIIPPKDLVELQQAPPPRPAPAPDRKPRRLVDLQHIPTPKPTAPPKPKQISRRSSVKDLVQGFEVMESQVKAVPPRVAELRRMGSIGSLKKKGERPAWKP